MTKSVGVTQSSKIGIRNTAIALALLLFLTLVMFADVLFATRPVVLSSPGTDTYHFFVHWRKFGFDQLRQGNLALWNPHYCCGMPFLGGFQSALLYPPNVLFLVLPLAKAIDWSIALHVFLAGAFMYAWTAHRGLHPVACFVSGALFMFGGTYFPHIYAGHLPNLCTMVWVPLLFLSIDKVVENPSLGGCLLGMFAVAMMILAGHLQYVFYTAIAAGIYCGFSFVKAAHREKTLLALAGIGAGGVGLSAVQLFTGIQESGETLRSVGLPYDFAAMFSFPPENFLTLLAPGFFGDRKPSPYWGRCYWWEMSLFLSVTGLVLSIFGAIQGERRLRRFSAAMIFILLLLALGAHTPLFKFLYHYVPGFAKFRGNSKFTFQASLFLIMLAGVGLDRMIRVQKTPRSVMGVTLAAGILIGGAALGLHRSALASESASWWSGTMQAMRDAGELFTSPQAYTDPGFVLRAGTAASKSLVIAAGTILLLALFLFLAKINRRFVFGIASLAVAEIFIFARASVTTFDMTNATPAGLKSFLAERPGDYRIVNPLNPDAAMNLSAQDIWGDDPGMLLRYAQFLAFTQGQNPDDVRQDIPFSREHPLFRMLRGRFIFVHEQQGRITIGENTNALPRLLLLDRYRVVQRRDDIFAAMGDARFDPAQEAILETEPRPMPTSANKRGIAKLISASTDYLQIEADLPSPAILLITDAYANGWRARALPGSNQNEYQVMPANYCLRAIPLAAGHHHFRVEYLPSGFVIGKWVSLASLCVFFGLVAWRGYKNFDRGRQRSA